MALFYRTKNFSGISTSYIINSNVANLSTNSNAFSSIKLTTNDQYIIVYDGINFSGNSMIITEDINDLSIYNFDKKIKSLSFYTLPTAANIYYSSCDASCSFNSISSNGDVYSCSGFFITSNGYLVTASHCVLSDTFNNDTQRYEPFTEFHVAVSNVNGITNNNKVMQARLVGYDQITDVALLKINGLSTQQFLKWGKSRQTPIGSRVYVLGNPLEIDEDSFSSGIVRDNKYNGEFPLFYVECVLTDSTIISGNSGGPLLNAIGQVISLTNYGIGDSNQLGGGVSQYVAEQIITRLLDYDIAGRPTRTLYNASNNSLTIPNNYPFVFNDGSSIYGYMGTTLIQIPKYLISYLNINNGDYKGAFVYGVDQNTDIARYVSLYDVIISIDNLDIGLFRSHITPHTVLMNKLPGSTVTIKYYKYSDGFTRLRTSIVILGRYPNQTNYNLETMSNKQTFSKEKTQLFLNNVKSFKH